MASLNKYAHLTYAERQIIETGIHNGSTKKSIADTIGKDKSTVGKEIKTHRHLAGRSPLSRQCAVYKSCKTLRKNGNHCPADCPDFAEFKCVRRDRSPGACNGCTNYRSCRFDKYRYSANEAQNEYETLLSGTRIGVNATRKEIYELGMILKPLLEQGQSIYAILQNHPEIGLCEKTIYNYIENGVFQSAGVSITNLDLKLKTRRKLPKNKQVGYSPRKDRKYLIGRTKKDFDEFISDNPDVSVVEMDTVYNDVSGGPFIQTFKFMKYDLLMCFLHPVKDTDHMRMGILLLETILGRELFESEVTVILTDRGSEFMLSDETEIRQDGTRRTRIFYCDPMQSGQKGSLENVHHLLRDICPKGVDLKDLGLRTQKDTNLISSHINSYPKEKLRGKSSFQLLEFLNQEMAQKLYDFGLTAISPDQVTLKPYLLKKHG